VGFGIESNTEESEHFYSRTSLVIADQLNVTLHF